jgi:hypothetical protein
MTEPPKYEAKDRKAPTGESLNKTAEAIKQRTPKSSTEILVKEGPDGVEFAVVKKVKSFGVVTLDPVRRPPFLPGWFSVGDLSPTLNAHFENDPEIEYTWDDGYNNFAVAGGYCFEGEFWVQIQSDLGGVIDCRFPDNDGLCPVGKTARVRVGEDWLDWLCTESDQARLECILTVDLQEVEAEAKHWQTNEQTVAVPPEMMAHCETGTIQAITAHGDGIIATAEVKGQVCEVIATTPPGHRGPTAVTLRLSGVRRGMPEIWPRTSSKVAAQNARHYHQAR